MIYDRLMMEKTCETAFTQNCDPRKLLFFMFQSGIEKWLSSQREYPCGSSARKAIY